MSPQWQKSSFSGVEGGNCIELAPREGHILLRESDTPDDILTLTRQELSALIRALR
ncbi:DUF397 domain-containing protein [Streptomyces sp. NPDC059063]|uniref:DUF397 domain-containing protein n=1 Tax=unclassified Streptomyces TaxID=2593676 RepID=UPI0036A8118E